MHELSIAISLVELASEEAVRQGDVRVAALRVRIGRLSGVVSEALRFSFDLAAEGTAIEGARLDIEHVPIRVQCGRCDVTSDLSGMWPLACPICHAPATLIGGREIELTSMEVIDAAHC
jgi:hydrogenase nickel incorporation protein HypA/HybF